MSSSTTASSGSRNFYFTIPLRGDPSAISDVFRIDSLPFSLPNSSLFAQHTSSARYIALPENRQLYFLLSSLDHCSKHDHLLVCPPTGSVYEASHTAACESSSLLNLRSMFQLCQTTVLTTFSPLFIKGPGYWTYSLTLTLTCPTNPVNKHNVRLTGSGVLTLRQWCSAHSLALTLPGHDTGIEGAPITVSHSLLAIHFPPLPGGHP